MGKVSQFHLLKCVCQTNTYRDRYSSLERKFPGGVEGKNLLTASVKTGNRKFADV